jgi:GNAT superfamily N-acetyltransferase
MSTSSKTSTAADTGPDAEWLAAHTTEHELSDGTRVVVRPLLPSDREELVRGFEQLSSESRRLRFLSSVEHLTEDAVDYLTTLDYDDHFAFAAFDLGAPGRPGIGVARYIRDRDDPTRAEPAVTVVEAYQRRGLGSLLLVLLAEEALGHGIRTFVAYVLWENRSVLEGLTAAGARVSGEEPGVARVEIDLPGASEERPGFVRRLLREVAAALRPHAG